MADFCYYCKKKIGLLGKLSSQRVEEQTLCGNCMDKVKQIATLYNRDYLEYSLKDMGILIDKFDSFDRYLKAYEKIDAERTPKIREYKSEIEKEKKELKESENGLEKEKREYEKELRQAEAERKAYCASSDYKEELKEYEVAQRRGDTVAINNLREILSFPDRDYQLAVEGAKKIYGPGKEMYTGFIKASEATIDGYEKLIEVEEDYNDVKKYIFRISEVPSEKVVLGHTLPHYAEEKSNGKNYIIGYLNSILKIDKCQTDMVRSNDILLAEFGKNLVESEMQKTFTQYYVNEGRLKRTKYTLDAHNALIQVGDYESVPQELVDEINNNEKNLDKFLGRRDEIDREFDKKETKLSVVFLELVEKQKNEQMKVQKTTVNRGENAQSKMMKAETVDQVVDDQTKKITSTVENQTQQKKISCGHCGKENKVGAKFCKFCGYQLVEEKVRFCTECGNKIKPGKKFCSACGAKVED